MKTQKNKIVFVLVLACMVLFITIYSIVTFGKPKKESLDVGRIPMPDLEDTSVEFETKLEAVEAIKVEKQSTAPQVYPDHMVDDKCLYCKKKFCIGCRCNAQVGDCKEGKGRR